MKTRKRARFSPSLVSLLLGAVLLASTGCVAVVAGAGAGAAVAYVRGQLEASVDASFEDTVHATDQALGQLGFAKISERKDALIAVFVARNAADKKIEIRLDNMARELTKLRIRIGVFGDESLSISILEKIKGNL